LFIIPTVFVILWQSSQLAALTSQLPYSASFGLGIMPWFGLGEYIQSNTALITQNMYLLLLVAIPVMTVAFSGGFAVVRDAYWTGKLRVCKSFFKGVKQTGLKFLPFMLVFALGFMGEYYLSLATQSLAPWLQTAISAVVIVLLVIVLMFGFIYLGTSTLYKESVAQGLKNAFNFMRRQFFMHLISFLFAMLPVILIIFAGGSVIGSMIVILFIMFGMIWISLVWMIHMIRSTMPFAKK